MNKAIIVEKGEPEIQFYCNIYLIFCFAGVTIHGLTEKNYWVNLLCGYRRRVPAHVTNSRYFGFDTKGGFFFTTLRIRIFPWQLIISVKSQHCMTISRKKCDWIHHIHRRNCCRNSEKIRQPFVFRRGISWSNNLKERKILVSSGNFLKI